MLHAGFTIWGRRQVQYARGCDGVQPDATESSSRAADVAWEAPVSQAPGDFYVGNLCAPLHRVVHGEPVEAEPLFHGAGGNGFLITAMLRTDVFRANRARIKSHKARIIVDDGGGVDVGVEVVIVVAVVVIIVAAAAYVAASAPPKATPTDVYDAVNEVVAEWLAAEPIRLPTFEECLAAYRA